MLYLVDKPLAEIGFRTARSDDDAVVVLIQDGVLLSPDLDAPTYAVERDAEVRGVDLPPDVKPVSYDRLVAMIVDREVKSFV